MSVPRNCLICVLLVVLISCSPAPAPATAVASSTLVASPTSTPRPAATHPQSSQATLTLAPSPSLESTPSATLTPEDTPRGSRVDRYQAIYYSQVPAALGMMLTGEYADAIGVWNQAIAGLPDYGYAYYQRALSYFRYSLQTAVQAESIGALEQARQDVNRAMELGPPSGDHYLLRYNVYRWFARHEPLRENNLAWLELALQDAYEANRLENSDPASDRYPADLLNDLGRCQGALDEFASLLVASPNALQRADLHAGLAGSYLCFGWLEAALAHIDLALSIQPSTARRMTRMIILFNMGELDAAKASLDEWIKAEPDYYAERYFFRALIYHDLGQYDLARADLEFATPQVYDLRGVGAYVTGLLAIRDGDAGHGWELVEYAERTLDYGYGPLLNRVRADLGLSPIDIGQPRPPATAAAILTAAPATQLALTPTATAVLSPTLGASQVVTSTPTGVSLPLATWSPAPSATPPAPWMPAPTLTLLPTATRPPTATPAPTASLLPTASPLALPSPSATLTPTLQAASGFIQPPAFSLPPVFVFRDLLVDYDGTGPFLFGVQPGGITFYFHPAKPLEFERIRSLSFTLETADPAAAADLFLMLFGYDAQGALRGGPGIAIAPGENLYPAFDGYVERSGGMFVRLINRGSAPLEVLSLGVRLVIEKADGTQELAGSEDAGE